MKLSEIITLLIITNKKSKKDLLMILKYYVTLNIKIIIVSNEKIDNFNNSKIINLNLKKKKKNIIALNEILKKIQLGLKNINTEYVLLSPDDDFFCKNVLYEILKKQINQKFDLVVTNTTDVYHANNGLEICTLNKIKTFQNLFLNKKLFKYHDEYSHFFWGIHKKTNLIKICNFAQKNVENKNIEHFFGYYYHKLRNIGFLKKTFFYRFVNKINEKKIERRNKFNFKPVKQVFSIKKLIINIVLTFLLKKKENYLSIYQIKLIRFLNKDGSLPWNNYKINKNWKKIKDFYILFNHLYKNDKKRNQSL